MQTIPGFERSNRVDRSPPRQSERIRNNSCSNKNANTNQIDKTTKPTEEKLVSEQITVIDQSTTTTAIDQTKITVTRQKKKSKTMNQQDIQSRIAGFIPEFSGEDTPHRSEDVLRFLQMSKDIFKTLTTVEEKTTFTQLLKYKLTGEAYSRISKREVEDYTTLSKLLMDMYTVTLSLDDLETRLMQTHQTYGETVRNYGYRLTEAMDQYKNGYKTKYGLRKIDDTYNAHLENSAIQTFKRGLNNTILKEKVATFRAKTIDEVIEETEAIEKMLMLSTSPIERLNQSQQTQLQNQPQSQNSQNKPQPKPTPVICNYCQKPNHTWDKCRTRMANSIQYNNIPHFNSRPQFQLHPNQFTRNQYQQNQFSPRTQPQRNQPLQQSFPRNQFPQTTQFTTYRQPTQSTTRYQPKYCSHCKNTTGHTFDECRSKFFAPRNINTNNIPKPQQQPPDGNNLETQFTSMRINPVYPQEIYQNLEEQEQPYNQGNANGSGQS